MNKKIIISAATAIIFISIILLICCAANDAVVLKWYAHYTYQQADVEYVLRKNRVLEVYVGARKQQKFDPNDFFEEIVGKNEAVITQEEYDAILNNVELIVAKDLKFSDELNVCNDASDNMVNVFVYGGDMYAADYFLYDDEHYIAPIMLKIYSILEENAFSGNPIWGY